MNDSIDVASPSGERLSTLEKPQGPGTHFEAWGSDVIADLLRALDIPFFALVPGSSFRGLHDSLVNRLGNRAPQMVLCLHEEHAVAIADGYARATDRPLAVGLHANVGLMHAAMPIYNAWCDRQPMLIVGATGPVDAHQRRPWIDWVHTSRDQGALVRGYVKWDDQPASVEASVEALLRAYQIATTAPFGPTYVCLDVSVQEERLDRTVTVPDVTRYAPPRPPAASEEDIDAVAQAIGSARRPLFLYGRMSRSQADWDRRIALADAAGAAVMTSMHNAAAFPTSHPRHLLAPCGEARTSEEIDIVAQADLIVSFDWMDLAGFLRSCTDHSQTQKPIATPLVHCSLDGLLANGWSMDHQALPAVDIPVLAYPDAFAGQLLAALEAETPATDWTLGDAHWTARVPAGVQGDRDGLISLADFALAVRAIGDREAVTYARLPLGWPREASQFDDRLAYLGKDGGGTVGVGPGNVIGAALALRDSGRIVVGVLGDGDTAMGVNALWTASHLALPVLIIVGNNTSYFNDERHQERVANTRGRPRENRWIGQRLADPEIDLLAMAKAQGFDGEPAPVRSREALDAAIARGIAAVKAGGRYIIDARIEDGYLTAFGQPPE